MANRYQGLHARSRTGFERWRLAVGAAGAVAAVALTVVIVAAVATGSSRRSDNRVDRAPSAQVAERLTASNVPPPTSKPSVPSGTTTIAAPPPSAPPAGYVEPTAVWTSYTCVANGFAWDVSYTVQFTGGSGWESLDGGTSATEHWGVPQSGPVLTGPPQFMITLAQVFDTVTNQGRFVDLANPITIHCPARG